METQLRDTTTTDEQGTPHGIAAARAAAVVSAARVTPVRLTGRDIGFGDGDLFNDDPLGFGLLTWETANNTLKPRLTGKLYLKNAMGVTARMQMRYFDVHGSVLATQVGGSVTATDNALHSFTVDLAPYVNPLVYRVDVSTTVQGQPGSWLTVSLQTCYLSSTTQPPDGVRLPGTDVDFGDGDLVNNEPIGFGLLAWDLANNTIKPRLTGKLYLKSAMGVTARMQMRYFDVHGTVLATKAGRSVTATDNALHSFTVDLAPYANPLVYRVDVSTTIQGRPDQWLTVTAQTSFI